MLCFSCLWLQGHHKDKNNPQWQICFQKVSHSFSIIPEKYCTIVLTPIECFDRGLMYYPVCPVIQMPPPFVLGNNVRVWNAPLGSLLLYPDTCCAILNFDLNLKKKMLQKMLSKLDLCWTISKYFLVHFCSVQMILFPKLIWDVQQCWVLSGKNSSLLRCPRVRGEVQTVCLTTMITTKHLNSKTL